MPVPPASPPLLHSSLDLCFSSFNVHGDPWGLLKCRLDGEPPGGTSSFQGAPLAQLAGPQRPLTEHKEACVFVMGRVAAKMKTA